MKKNEAVFTTTIPTATMEVTASFWVRLKFLFTGKIEKEVPLTVFFDVCNKFMEKCLKEKK